jgi:hypothetical protein
VGVRRWLARKESATARIVVQLVTPGRPVWTPIEYRKLAKEGYRRNAIVYACIQQVVRAGKGIPWRAYTGDQRTIRMLKTSTAVGSDPLRHHHRLRRLKAAGDLTEVETHPVVAAQTVTLQRDKLDHWLSSALLGALAPTGDMYMVGTLLHHDAVLKRLMTRGEPWQPKTYQALHRSAARWAPAPSPGSTCTSRST